MAKELGSRGIAVNTVAQGAIETDFGGGVVRDNKDLNKHLADSTALGRVGFAKGGRPTLFHHSFVDSQIANHAYSNRSTVSFEATNIADHRLRFDKLSMLFASHFPAKPFFLILASRLLGFGCIDTR